MNTTRLYTVSTALTRALDESRVHKILGSLDSSLASQISSPEAQHLTAIEAALENLDALRGSDLFKFPETWNATLEELGARDLKEAAFAEQAIAAVRGNGVTIQTAKSAVESLRSRLNELSTNLKQAAAALEKLQLNEVEQPSMEAELSALIPRTAFQNEVAQLAKELSIFAKILEFAEEFTSGSRSPAKLLQLSTTDPIILAGLSVSACLLLLKMIKEAIDLITSTYALREARAKALQAEGSRKLIKVFDEEIKDKIEKGLTEISERLSKQAAVDAARHAELKVEMRAHLERIATRLDHGFQFDGNASERDGDDENEDHVTKIREVNALAAEIRYLPLPTEPVLQLKSPAEERDPAKPPAQ